MTPKTRTPFILAALAALLMACGTAPSSEVVDPTPTVPASPSATPDPTAEPTPVPTDSGTPVSAGTLTVADGLIVDGPGEPLSAALQRDLTEPVFARGVLFLDTDGTLWLAESIEDPSVPTFSDIRVKVANYPTDGPTWDMANAELIGLQEVNGIRFFEETRLYGTITP